ncbi:NADPH-dependent aldo-keto reductase, chloroplastic [Glycine soja]
MNVRKGTNLDGGVQPHKCKSKKAAERKKEMREERKKWLRKKKHKEKDEAEEPGEGYPIRMNKGTEGFKAENIVPSNIPSTSKEMEALYDNGKARAIRLGELLEVARVPPTVNQLECHLAWRQDKLEAFCKSKGGEVNRSFVVRWKDELEHTWHLLDSNDNMHFVTYNQDLLIDFYGLTRNHHSTEYKVTCSNLDVPSTMHLFMKVAGFTHLNLKGIMECRIVYNLWRKTAKIGNRGRNFAQSQNLQARTQIIFEFRDVTSNFVLFWICLQLKYIIL